MGERTPLKDQEQPRMSQPACQGQLLLYTVTTPPIPHESPGALRRSPVSQAHLGGS